MEVGIIGLGKMGLNIAQRLQEKEFQVKAFDINAQATQKAAQSGMIAFETVAALADSLKSPKVIWLMLTAGEVTNSMVNTLGKLLHPGDYVIDGGNSHFENSVRNHKLLAEKGIYFFDCGTSGGTSGARNGGNLMIGGDEAAFAEIEPIFAALAQKNGYLFTGEPGSGHYLKMVHNGIEYGMMQAIAEGFDLLENSPYSYNNEKVALLWNNGSVIRSWLMELMYRTFSKNPHLEGIKGMMYSSGEGQWTMEEALKRKIPMPALSASLMMRYRSLQEDTFTGKVVASLRNEFGGHAVDRSNYGS